jgi:hypothetical protein
MYKKKKSGKAMGPYKESEMDMIPFNNSAIKKIMINRGVASEGTQGSVFKTKKPETKA